MNIEVTVNGKKFTAVLADNKAAEMFYEMLPLSFEMEDQNGNEKCRYMSKKLPQETEAVGEIQMGDIMLFGPSCLVVFYKSFQTTHSYTRIGHIENADGLDKAAGGWDAEIAFRKA